MFSTATKHCLSQQKYALMNRAVQEHLLLLKHVQNQEQRQALAQHTLLVQLASCSLEAFLTNCLPGAPQLLVGTHRKASTSLTPQAPSQAEGQPEVCPGIPTSPSPWIQAAC